MRFMRAMLLGMSLLSASSLLGSAQAVVTVQYQDEDDRQAYREGYRKGQWDANHGLRADWDDNRWREADDRRWYRDGYLRGYREVSGGSYGDGRRYTEHYAERTGYQDGLNDGVRDRRTGHSFRPTHDDHYEDADHGYQHHFGDKGYYKHEYREGYRRGYEQGYNSGWRSY